MWTSEIINNSSWCLYSAFYSQGLKLFTQGIVYQIHYLDRIRDPEVALKKQDLLMPYLDDFFSHLINPHPLVMADILQLRSYMPRDI